MLNLAKRIAYSLPPDVQERLKTVWYHRRIRRGNFLSHEPEYARLVDWIRPGDTVVDVGANIGLYALRMSELVGPRGRVIALEPVPQTFRLLAKHTAPLSNVTLLNVAASNKSGTANIEIPIYNGWLHPTRARISDAGSSITTLRIDGLELSGVSLVKIDVEGHEFEVLSGMTSLLERQRPVLIVEGEDERVFRLLSGFGYRPSKAEGSPNTVYVCEN